MKPHQSLERKYVRSVSAGPYKSRLPVSSTLQDFLTRQSTKIEKVIDKKQNQEGKVERISTANLKYREELRQKLMQSQNQHQQKRNNFLDQRVKREKNKMKKLKQKRDEHDQFLITERNQRIQAFEENKNSTKNFWSAKVQSQTKNFAHQIAVEPLYEDAVHKKKVMERQNQVYGSTVKDQMLSRHTMVKERVELPVKEYKHILHLHNFDEVEENQEKHDNLLQEKQNKYVNDICFHQDRSNDVLAENKKQEKEKWKKRKFDEKQIITKNNENFKQRQMKRVQSMKQCKCHNRQINKQQGITQSIVFNEQYQKTQFKRPKVYKERNWSIVTMKQSLKRSQLHFQIVKNNKQILKQRKEMKDEKKLISEKQITEALKIKSNIRNDSNCYVRKSRISQNQ